MYSKFTYRDAQIFSLWVRGHSIVDIAAKLGITVKGVKWHMTHMYKVCGVKSKSELVKQYWTKEREEIFNKQIGLR